MAKGGKNGKKQPGDVKYDPSSKLPCPDCLEMVHVGTGGPANLKNHKPACKGRPKGITQKITDLFARKPHAPLVPSTVSSAPLVTPPFTDSGNVPDASLASSLARDPSPSIDFSTFMSDASSCLEYTTSDASHVSDTAISVRDGTPNEIPYAAPSEQKCNAIHHLRLKLEQIPAHITGDTLVDFAGNPADFFGPSEPEERDKILHDLLERVFGSNSWGYDLNLVRQYLYRGSKGLDAFCDFFEYFVCKRRFSVKNILDIILFLEEGIDHEYPDLNSAFDFVAEFNLIPAGRRQFISGNLQRAYRPQPPRQCRGWRLIFPEGQNPHTSYPFGVHAEYSLPWGYELANGSLFLRADGCLRHLREDEEECEPCSALPRDSNLRGILDRILNGVHENSRLTFHPIANLVDMHRRRTEQLREKNLVKLNNTRTIMRKMATIDNQKELTMAIASGKILRISVEEQPTGEYKPMNDEREKALAVALWRVGGGRLAEIGHRALGLPGLNTLRQNNLMVMIKNVFFCVAKTKVDIPDGKFWLILLGTDRLETFFGLLRSAIGPDSNVDLLQLANRASGLCEIAVIMTEHPEWDRAPRRLKLPAVGEAGKILPSKFDHLNPTSWRGNTEVRHVSPLTCWIQGRKLIEEFLPETCEVFEHLSKRRADIFSPCGKPLIEIYDEEDIEAAYQSLELEAEFPPPPSTPAPESEPTYAGDDDVEDAMAVEEPRGGFDTHIEFNGSRLTKAKALRLAMAGLTGARASTDRTKRVASIPCYQDSGIYDDEPQILGGPCLRIDNPICTLVRCEKQLFLAIGAVNSISFGSDKVQEIGLDFLADKDTKVSFEIMCLVRTTVEDDPTKRHDWRWSQHMDRAFGNIPGRLVQPINPTLSIRTPTKPTYLFESSELMAFGATLLERLASEDLRHIPNASRTENFPYCFQGKACFLCEHDTNGRSIDTEPQKICPKCTPSVPLDIAHGQRILEHCAAHLLYDSSINRQHELCGLCMRPTPMCVFYLRRTNGKPQIDWDKSTCQLKVSIRYAVAAESTSASPCSNVPVICTLCGPKRPAVWKYNLEAHFRNVHQLHNPQSWPMNVGITDDEKTGLKRIWDSRQNYPRPRNLKKKKNPLVISEAHSSRLAFRNLQRRGIPENEGELATNSLLHQTETSTSTVDVERSVSPAAASDDDDDFPPPSLLLWRRKTARQRIESDDEMEDDYHQAVLRDTPNLGMAQADGSLDEASEDTNGHTESAVAVPQEILQASVRSAEDVTAHTPVEAHNSLESSLLPGEETPEEGRELPQTAEEPTAPAKRTRRTAKLLNLGGCDACQMIITDAEKSDRSLVAECSKKGCETRWAQRDEGMIVSTLSFDLKGAFNSISHRVVAEELAACSFSRSTIACMLAFLDGHWVTIVIDGKRSITFRCTGRGALQGSALSVILFLICINRLHCLSSLCTGVVAVGASWKGGFAVDDVNFLTASRSILENVKRLELAGNVAKMWEAEDNAEFEEEKTELTHMHLGRKDYSKVSVRFGGKTIMLSETVKWVGIVLDRSLSGRAHIEY
ncbi:hypothetical protein MVEN_01624700 [Mycena venus]|uniref:Reverse transcriptase domain-containing protein n=1 Tax=Mycena venus TaxID=2733690 RepID=A0A8H6XQS2_9AGAR|nr:hypothetical protein MVEN_01624700 [Mycena venus]